MPQQPCLKHHQQLARSRSPGFDSTDEEAAAVGEEAAAGVAAAGARFGRSPPLFFSLARPRGPLAPQSASFSHPHARVQRTLHR